MDTPDRLSALDAEFLHLEDEVSPMHIAGVCVFEGPSPGLEALAANVAGRLDRIPRYRQVVKTVPLELGRPVWVDDPDFHLEHHLHHTALPAPGGRCELDELMGRLMEHALDRSRPLWEAWLVEGVADDRWALVFKVHHCMVDGMAGIDLLLAFLDVDPDPDPAEPSSWNPAASPSGLALVSGAIAGFASDLAPWLRRWAGAARTPVDTASGLVDLGAGVAGLLSHLGPTPGAGIHGPIGPHRTWSHTTLRLDDISRVRRRFGGTVNDVLLACVTAGHRDLLVAHGHDPDSAVVRTVVPVSTRARDPERHSGNRVSVLVTELPVDLVDPVERLAAIRARTEQLKSSHMADAADTLVTLADLLPPWALGSWTRGLLRLDHRVAQRSLTTVTTNVPGPQFPLYCLGREMLEQLPYLGLSDGIRVTTAITSYHGRVSIGVTGDEDSVPDVAIVTAAVDRSLRELVQAARRRQKA